MTQVVNLLLDKMVTHFTTAMITNINEGHITRADIVKKGLLQENRKKNNIAIGITGGDHDDPAYIDGIISLEKLPNISFRVPAREIGGGVMFFRRGVIKIECFFIKERLTEDQAHDAAYEVLGRAMSEVEKVNLNGLTDSYGETAVKLFFLGNTFFESGGPPKSFIFRGKIFWECLTERY